MHLWWTIPVVVLGIFLVLAGFAEDNGQHDGPNTIGFGMLVIIAGVVLILINTVRH